MDQPQPAAVRRRRRSAQDLTRRILQAAAGEFKRCGYAGATTASIAQAADVTEAQLFRYYKSKANLFREAIFRPLDEELEAFNLTNFTADLEGAEFEANVHIYVERLRGFLGDNAGMLKSLIDVQAREQKTTGSVSEITSLDDYFARGAAMMGARSKDSCAVEPALMVRVSFAAVLACVMFKDWLFPPGLAGEAAIADAVDLFVLHGISANEKR